MIKMDKMNFNSIIYILNLAETIVVGYRIYQECIFYKVFNLLKIKTIC